MLIKIHNSRGAVMFRCASKWPVKNKLASGVFIPGVTVDEALPWHGKGAIRCDTVPDPKIEDGRDAISKVTACAICGSDLHIFDGVIPSMERLALAPSAGVITLDFRKERVSPQATWRLERLSGTKQLQ